MKAIVMVTTVGNEEEGNDLARELVARRQAACVNMVPGIKSFYRWQGKVCHDGEYMLIIKTRRNEYDAVSDTIRELHSYDLPEILAFDIAQGDPKFLEWIRNSLDKDAEFDDETDDYPEVD